ncbi:MAG: serine/threonine-protein kinase [Chloroflexota bacterium]
MKFSPSAQLAWDSLEAAAQLDGCIWGHDLLVALSKLSLRKSALAFALNTDEVWAATWRNQLDNQLRPGNGYSIQTSKGAFRPNLMREAEAAAKKSGDDTVAEWHLAEAIAACYGGQQGLGRLGVMVDRLVPTVKDRERDNELLKAPSKKAHYGNRWHRLGPLGEGGQGRLWLVEDLLSAGSPAYVLKELVNPKRADRFRREVEAIRMVNHPNVIKLVDFDANASPPFLVSEFYSRGNLEGLPLELRQSPQDVFRLFLDICRGLAQAHSVGIIHRDIKPANILLGDGGQAVVADFGISILLEEDTERLTHTVEVVASRWFGAPELEDGRLNDISPASDVYSLGKLLHWMFVGRPFNRESFESSGRNVADVIGPVAGEHVNRLLRRMIVEQSSARFSDASAVLAEAQATARLLTGGFNAVSASVPQRCTYCGDGSYAVIAKDHDGVRNFGLDLVGHPDWRILVCDCCGHVQLFRLDMAKRRDLWKD